MEREPDIRNTYDIVHAGPNDRFMANGRIVSNSGRLLQLQNLPQNHLETLDEARELVKMGCFDMVESIYGNTPDVLSQLVRTMLIPRDGYEFLVADFSAIEARVLAWEAGEEWRLEAFRNGEDIYCASASRMFGVPVVKHGVNSNLRQRGKVSELACIARNSLVLTDRGEIPIQYVTKSHRVWDGLHWVRHDGVVFRGLRKIIHYDGLSATEDHLVYVENQLRPVKFSEAVQKKLRLKRKYRNSHADNFYTGFAPVYDILNAGKRHRFTVSGCLVHNCGYGGGTGALIKMGALDMGVQQEELPGLIEDWRRSNPNIVQYWRDMEKAAIDTVKTGQTNTVGKIRFSYSARTLWMHLPSGRKLAYISPRLQPNRFGRMAITFMGVGDNNRWERQETYGSRIVENATQSIARDILAEAMLRMDQAGLEIVGSVHDEILAETPIGKYTVEEVCGMMAERPDWCSDMPIAAAGFKSSYYRKD